MTKDTELFSITTEVLGMTLRDWFAGQALQGMLAHDARHPEERLSGWTEAEYTADKAYRYADAMLEARKK